MLRISLNQDWRFFLGEPPQNHHKVLDETGWKPVKLPHDWSIGLERRADCPSADAGGFFPMGRGWYRKSIDVPEEWAGKRVMIEFEGVYMNAEVWLDEHFLGRHPYGYTSFFFDLTPFLKLGAKNVLRVFVDNSNLVNSRWYSGSGIYRPVWLLLADVVHVDHWGVAITTPVVKAEAAAVHIRTRVVNESQSGQDTVVRSRVMAPDGALLGISEAFTELNAGGTVELTQDLRVVNPQLWSPDSPALYRMETEVIVKGKVADTCSTPFGIRSVEMDAERGFVLNGQSMKLKGGCVHHDNGILGAASYARSEERKVEVHKASGYNAIRCAHNPPAPAFLEACDRLGMLVIDESFDCWREGKNPGDYHTAFDDWWQRDIESMVFRDRNHPCVVFWSIGNELIERGRPEGFALAHELAEMVRKLDPTRPVTAAMCGPWDESWTWPQSEGFFAALDTGGYNYQWAQYRSDHVLHPQRVMMGTESFPKEAYENWTSVLELPYVIGDFVWTSLDYLGESGIGRMHYGEDEKFLGVYPWHQANCGDLDLCGFKRPQSYYRDILWQRGASLYIAVHYPVPAGKTAQITRWGWPDVAANWNWSGHEGQAFTVDVYSACEKVELFLNGNSLGVKAAGSAEKYMATFEVPYEPGELKVVGYRAGQPNAEAFLRTTSPAARLHLHPDRGSLRAEEGDLCYVTVEVVDSEGRMDPNAEQTVFFTIKGEGELAAVGSANPMSTELYRGSQRKAYRGRCLVVVKSTGKAGEIRLSAHADNLDGAEVVINCV